MVAEEFRYRDLSAVIVCPPARYCLAPSVPGPVGGPSLSDLDRARLIPGHLAWPEYSDRSDLVSLAEGDQKDPPSRGPVGSSS